MLYSGAALGHDGEESGMSLIEVIVALFIFAIISTGVIYGMISVMAMTHDSRARQVATNLAASEIDLSRDKQDLFGLLTFDRTFDVNGNEFTVHRVTQWVSDPGLSMNCGTGGGALRYKRVDVTVTWPNMRAGTEPVRSNTVINPRAAINDPTKGTILVSVLGAAGTGQLGVAVTAVPGSPPNGATPLVAAPVPTDAQGCTYVLKVTPGNYNVKVTKANFIDNEQVLTTMTRTVGVGAGAAASVGFEFDEKVTVNLTYGAEYTPASNETVLIPAAFPTSFGSTHAADGTFNITPAAAATRTRTVALYPFSSGYEVFAGDCLAADPAAWPIAKEGVQNFSGVRAPGIATLPGSVVSAAVPVGVVKLALGTGASGASIRAIPVVGAASGDPGCPGGGSSVPYSFGSGSGYTVPASGNVTLLLPYGSWSLYWGSASNPATAVLDAQMSFPAVPVPARSTKLAGVVSFDPRVVVP